MTRQDLRRESLRINAQTMEVLVRKVRRLRSADRKASLLQRELKATKAKLASSLLESEVAQASACFERDGK